MICYGLQLKQSIELFLQASDKSFSITEISKFIKEEPALEPSPIRLLDLGNNYFRHINPRKKKTML